METSVGLALLVFVAFLSALGQMFFKLAAREDMSIWKKFINPRFLWGVVMFLSCPMISSIAAQAVSFSMLYGMTSLNFIFILSMSGLVLKERVDLPKIGGVLLIMSGLAVLVITS